MQKRNMVQKKAVEKSIVEEESSKYSLFESDKDAFEYERAMLKQVQNGKHSAGLIEEVYKEGIPNQLEIHFHVQKKKSSRNPLLKGPNTGPGTAGTSGTNKTGTNSQAAGLSTKSTKMGM